MENSKKLNRILSCMLIYAFVTMLNQTSINTALSTIRHVYEISTSTVQWISTIYLLVSGIMVPVTAYLSTRYNIKNLFIFSLFLFIVGILVSGLAINFEMIIIGRIIQAIGGGIAAPLMQIVIFTLAPLNKRGSLMGVLGLVVGVAPAFGPSISGWLISRYDWHSIFLVYVPILIFNLLLSIFYMPSINEPNRDVQLHKGSVVLSTITFGSILFSFSQLGDKGIYSPYVYGSFFIGIIVFIVFYFKQVTMENPLLNFEVLKYGIFRLAIILVIISNIALIGVGLLLPIYLQEIHGYSALAAGIILLPGAFLSSFVSIFTGKIFDKYGAKYLSIVGFFIMASGTYILGSLHLDSSATLIAILYLIRCIGISMVMMPPQTAAMNKLPVNLIGHGTAMLNTIRTIAGAVGTAVLVSIMTASAKNYSESNLELLKRGVNIVKTASLEYGYHMSMMVATVIAIIGMILSIKLPKNR